MVDLPQSYDLGPLMRALSRRSNKRAKAAGHALKAYRDGRSALHDLLFAFELSDFLESRDPLNGGAAGDEPHAVRGACLAHAILLYVRATVPAKQERLPLAVAPFPREELKILHHQLATLRNKGIAHFDYERPVGDKSFADDALIVIHDDTGQRIDVADRRVVYQAHLEIDVRELLEHAISVTIPRLQQILDDVLKYLPDLSREDPTIAELIDRYPFDAVEFYGSETRARAFLNNGEPEGERFGMKNVRAGWPDWPKPRSSDVD